MERKLTPSLARNIHVEELGGVKQKGGSYQRLHTERSGTCGCWQKSVTDYTLSYHEKELSICGLLDVCC